MTEFTAPLPILARYAVMVDVGYIYAAAGELLFGSSSRRDFRVDAVPLIQVITKHADELIRGELLRVYWYDAARDRVPTIDQRVIAQMPWVKLRLGNLNARGQQKGVDAQIRADMEALARHRAITDAVLIAGDEDMVPAVEAAQAYGVRVHLWGIEPPYGTNQAERLVWESDTVDVLDASFLRPYFSKNPVPVEQVRPPEGTSSTVPSPAQLFGDRHIRVAPGGSPASRTGAHAIIPPGGYPSGAATGPMPRLGPERSRVEEAGEHVAQKWILTRGRDNIRDLLPGPILPPVIDKELLVDAEKELGLSLRPYQEAREWLRDAFWERVHREFGIGVGKSPRLNLFSSERTVVTLPASEERPVLRVIRGDATPEEIAALVAVVMARASASSSSSARPGDRSAWSSARSSAWSSAWSDRTRQLRAPIRPAPGAWRRSALPR